jgi:ribosomal protein S18 acetylase RimI-like enzyme
MMRVSIRSATSDDVGRIVEIVNGEPGEDAIALMGSVELAHRYRERMVELEGIPNPSRVTVVAEASGRVVGLLQYRLGNTGRHGRLAHLRVLASLLGPIGVLRRAPCLWARTRVGLPIPVDSFYITNVHVENASQGQGVGSQLLRWAEHEAIRHGARLMALTTISNSAAIPLYERNGFTITRTATHPDYERRLHVPGRVLMEKVLDS